MPTRPLELFVGLGVALLATPLLAALARRFGFADDPASQPGRKRQARPVPPVAGPAILLAWGVARLALGESEAAASSSWLFGWRGEPREALLWLAFGLAFATGLVDDLLPRGLSPLQKLGGQALAGVAFGCALTEAPLARLLEVFLAVLAQNLVNTWDNADGAAATLGAAGLGAAGLGTAGGFGFGGLLGASPYTLLVRRGGAPLAYLGDSGSHLIALGLLAEPRAALVLWLPLLDLARLSAVRLRAGSRPWVGDRRHLAHRLQRLGLGPLGVALALLAIAAPLVIAGALGSGAPLVGGALGVTTGLFLVALAVTRGHEPEAERSRPV